MSAPSSIKQPSNFLAARTGLVRDELHAEDLARKIAHFVHRARHLDAAALAAPARVNLRLHHPNGPAERLGGLHRFVDAERRDASRRGHAELAKDFLALVFVDLHGFSLLMLVVPAHAGTQRRSGFPRSRE